MVSGAAEHIKTKAQSAAADNGADADEQGHADPLHDHFPAAFTDEGFLKAFSKTGEEARLFGILRSCRSPGGFPSASPYYHQRIHSQIRFGKCHAFLSFLGDGKTRGSHIVFVRMDSGQNGIKGNVPQIQLIAVFFCKQHQEFNLISGKTVVLQIDQRFGLHVHSYGYRAVPAGKILIVRMLLDRRLLFVQPLFFQIFEQAVFF